MLLLHKAHEDFPELLGRQIQCPLCDQTYPLHETISYNYSLPQKMPDGTVAFTPRARLHCLSCTTASANAVGWC